MKIIMEPTTKFVDVNGVRTRVWQGKTERGIQCHAYIALIGVARTENAIEFDEELKEVEAPRADLLAIPARMILG